MVLYYNMLCITLYYNNIILRDHRRICGPSLTETSLCGAYLYLEQSTPHAMEGTLAHFLLDLPHTYWLAFIAIKRNWRMFGCRIIVSFTRASGFRFPSTRWPRRYGPVTTVLCPVSYWALVTNLCLANHYWISHERSNHLPRLFSLAARTQMCPVPWAEHCSLILWLDFWTDISNFNFWRFLLI